MLEVKYYVLFVFCVEHVSSDGKKLERMILHSDTDMAAEVLRLRSELANTTKQLGTVLSDMSVLKQDLSTLASAQHNLSKMVSGSVYVRWGKKTCPNGAEMVYNGYTGGKKFNDQGSGSDNLCLPSDPIWGKYVDGYQSYRGAIYGAETDIVGDIFPYSINQQDMPCAVCKSDKSTTLMIPARDACYPGWTLEYSGYLVGASASHYYSYNHVCLDGQPDFLDHGSANDDDHVFHLFEAHCGSLPCPPYVDGRELTCVVCSK